MASSSKKRIQALHHLLGARVHLGHRASRWHPQMAPYLYGRREGIHLLDLKESAFLWGKALRGLSHLLREGGRLLVVGNRRENALLVEALGQRYPHQVSFVTSQWRGGTLTNRQFFRPASGSSYFRGLSHHPSLPDLILILNLSANQDLLREAEALHLPTWGVVDSNLSPGSLTFPCVGNDDQVASHWTYLSALAYVLGKEETSA